MDNHTMDYDVAALKSESAPERGCEMHVIIQADSLVT